jgi:hypothetical protein
VGENYLLRPIPVIVNEALAALGGDFSALYFSNPDANGKRRLFISMISPIVRGRTILPQ